MIQMKRVCIPLGLKCNFNCRYCYRGLSVGDVPTKISSLMREFLMSLRYPETMAIIMSGGEPLLYVDTIKEIFSMIDHNLHKKVMTNGSLLTQELVDYFNDLNVEVSLSHDGPETNYLRGRDIFDEPYLLNLVKQIKVLTICDVITNKNPDIMVNYRYIVGKLGRSNFYHAPILMYYNGHNQDLIENFDYDTYIRSYREEREHVFFTVPYYRNNKRAYNFNVDLDGNIIDKDTLYKYGTVLNTKEECIAKYKEVFKDCYCDRANCPIRDVCFVCEGEASEHMCLAERMKIGYE